MRSNVKRIHQQNSVVEGFYSTVSVDLRRLFGALHLPEGLSRLHPSAVLLYKVHSRRALFRSSHYGLFDGFHHLPHRGSASTKFFKTSYRPKSGKYVSTLYLLKISSHFL